MNRLPWMLACTGIALGTASCGWVPSSSGGSPERLATTPPAAGAPLSGPASGSVPSPPREGLESIRSGFEAAWAGLRTLRASYENRQTAGGKSAFAFAKLTFARPRKVKIVFGETSNLLLSHVTVVWLGGPTLRGRRAIGPFSISQERPVKADEDLRGWTYDQTDYHALAASLRRGLPDARFVGRSSVRGKAIDLLEFAAALPGVRIERVGVDPVLHLPVYWEFREAPGGPIVYSALYTNLAPNGALGPDAFEL